MTRHLFALAAGVALILACVTLPASARLATPDAVRRLPDDSKGQPHCGVRAEYTISGSPLWVEIEGASAQGGIKIMVRVYAPNSVGPIMSDIWLKTTTLLSVKSFKPARENGQGILESSGVVPASEGQRILSEVAAGDAEISIIFDGVLPASRLPVGLPRPLPLEVAAAVDTCRKTLGG